MGTYPGNELTGSILGNTRPQSSQLAEPLWIDLGVKSGICAPADLNNNKKTGRG